MIAVLKWHCWTQSGKPRPEFYMNARKKVVNLTKEAFIPYKLEKLNKFVVILNTHMKFL